MEVDRPGPTTRAASAKMSNDPDRPGAATFRSGQDPHPPFPWRTPVPLDPYQRGSVQSDLLRAHSHPGVAPKSSPSLGAAARPPARRFANEQYRVIESPWVYRPHDQEASEVRHAATLLHLDPGGRIVEHHLVASRYAAQAVLLNGVAKGRRIRPRNARRGLSPQSAREPRAPHDRSPGDAERRDPERVIDPQRVMLVHDDTWDVATPCMSA